MKVQQTQHINLARLFQTIDDFEQLGCSQAKLGRFATGFFPATGTFRIKLHAHADHWRVAFVSFSNAQNVIELAQFFNNDDNALARFRAGETQLDELFIFETIQHEQTVSRLFQGHRRVQLSFRSRFQSKIVSRSFAQIFLDD